MVNEQTYRSAANVLQAGRDLQAALGDPDRVELAARKLASAAEQSMMRLDALGPMRFESDEEGAAPVFDSAGDAEDLLATAMSQLHEASTVLAASQAIGETGAPDPDALNRPMRGLADTLPLLQADNVPDVQNFAAAAAESATVSEAVAACRTQIDATLTALTQRSVKAITTSVTGMRDGGPDFLKKAWDGARKALNLNEIGGRLAKIGLRMLTGAIGLLSRVMPFAWLTAVRHDIDALIDKLDHGSPSEAVVGSVLGVDKARTVTTDALAKPELDPHRVDEATAALAALTGRHDTQLKLWDGISTGIGYVRAATAFLKFTVPNLGLIILGAHLVVVGAVVVIGRDYVGGDGPGGTDGLAMIVTNATS